MSKKVTIGYRYFMGLHFGISYGPVDSLLEIRAGDRTIWSGSQNASGTIDITSPNAFGGEEREGGVIGQLDVMMGEPTQAANAYLTARQGGAQPGYRGLFTAVFRGLSAAQIAAGLRRFASSGGYIGAMNPYVKPWAFKARRITQGWRTPVFYPARAEVFVNQTGASFTENCDSLTGFTLDAGGVAGTIESVGGVIRNPINQASNQTAIRKPFAIGRFVQASFDVRVHTQNPGDAMRLGFVRSDNGLVMQFFPRCESGSDIQQRAAIGSQANLIGAGALPLNVWHEVVYQQQGDNLVCTVRRKDNQALVGSATIANAATQEIVGLAFIRDGDSVGVNTPSGAEYDNVVIVGGGQVRAMNPAHIIYQCLTDTEWGMGYPTAAIDTASFTAAADTLHAEGFGLCLQWTRQDTIESFLQTIANHIGAVIATDRSTGRFVLNLIRGGYSIPSLPLFDESNVAALDSFQRSAPAESVNEIVVSFLNPSTNKTESVTVQNLASITAQGGVVSKTSPYPGLPSRDLAARVAQRDLLASTSNLAKVRFRINRSGFNLLPGAVVRFSWAKLGIVNLPLRVGRVDYGTLTDATITVEAIEDVFGLPSQSYIGTPPSGWVPQSGDATVPEASLVFEAPYRTIFRNLDPGDRSTLVDGDSFVASLAAAPSGSLMFAYDFETRTGANEFVVRERGAFAPFGTLTAQLSPSATSVTLTGGRGLNLLSVGEAAIIGGLEIVRITSIDLTTSTIGIARGCADTVPRTHASGATFFGLDDFDANDLTRYVNAEVVNTRIRTIAPAGALGDAASAAPSVTIAQRRARPYPPADLRVNTQRYPSSIVGPLVIDWNHRDRIAQQDQLVDTLAASVGPEVGTTYTIELYDQFNTLRRTVTGIAGTTYTWSTEAADSPSTAGGSAGMLRFEGVAGITTHLDEGSAAGLATWTNNGSAALSTAQTFFGIASLLLNGTNQWLSRSAGYGFGTGDFTITLRCRPSVAGVNMVLFDCRGSQPSAGGFALYRNAAGDIALFSGGADRFAAGGAIALGAWSVVRIARQGSNLRAFVNGTLVATWASVSANFSDNVAVIGRANPEANQYWSGHIQDLQVTVGAALSIATHTPSPYRASGRFGYTEQYNFNAGTLDGVTSFLSVPNGQVTNPGTAIRLRSDMGANTLARLDQIPPMADGAIECDVVIPPNFNSENVGVVYRTTFWGVANASWGCLAYVNHLHVGLVIGSNSGSPTVTSYIGSNHGLTPGTTARFRVEFVGDQHRIYLNGALVWTQTEATHQAVRGQVALRYSSAGTGGTVQGDLDNVVAYSREFERVWERDWSDGLTTGQTLFRGGTASHSVVSGRYRHTITGQGDSRFDALQPANLPIADGAFEVDIVVPAAGFLAGITYRSPSLATEWRYLVYVSSSLGYVIERQVSGAFTSLATDGSANPAAGSTVRLRVEVQGSTHRVYANGVLRLTVTDATSTAAGDVGLLTGNAPVSVDFDNFVAYRQLPPGLNNPVRFRLWSVRAGLASTQQHDLTVART